MTFWRLYWRRRGNRPKKENEIVKDVSGFGTSALIVALNSFPLGFLVTQFADDTDGIAIETIETTGFELLYDGSIFFYDKAAPIKVNVSVIAGMEDDINLAILLQARKGSFSLIPLPDVTSMIVSYPDGGRVAYSNGSMVAGPLGTSVSGSGRFKTNTYSFVFGAFAGFQSALETVATVGRAITQQL
jgi:hypothetical protein